MRKYQFEIVLALALAIIFAAFWWWQTPGSSGKLTGNEVDAYIQRIAPNLPLEPGEKAEVLARFRAWGQADDGDPVYMLNVMRYFDQLKRIPGAEAIKGTPAQANAHYEDAVLPILTRLGAYPLVGGPAAGVRGADGRMHTNLLDFDSKVDDWSRVLVVRYPNRRAFFDLISDPAYIQVMPYKLAALEVALVPVRAELVVPDLRWVLGMVLLAAFFALGWLRASRRR